MKKFLQKLVVILFVGVFAVGAFAQTTPTIAEGEQAVFFENTENWSGDIYAYIWADGGAVEWVGGWPGEACTYLGDNIWKWTYSGKMNIYGETTVYGGLIFNNKGAGMQTADLEFVNGGYYNANGYVKTITPAGGDEVDSSLVALSNVFVAGSFNNWASTDQEHSMSLELDLYIKRYENMPAGTYEFKIVDNGKWIGAEYVDAANSTKGYVGVPGGNISFTLPQPATVIISYTPWYGAIYLVAEGIDKFGQFEIEYYSVCGSKEIFGEEFLTDAYREKIDDYKMVEEDGVYTKTFTSIHLDADVEYRYKVAANGTWNEGQYPQNGDMLFTVSQTGIYDLTFTYIPATSTSMVDPVLVENLGEEESELSDTVRFVNIASIYKKGIWEMERYQDYSAFSVIAILESQPTVVDKVVSSSAWGNATNNYYLNDGTGVIVLQAPATGVDSWMGTTIEGLELEVGTKLPAEFFATIDFKAVIDDETLLPSGEVYGAPVMTFMPKVLGVEVDEYGLENQITESYADFVARCEVSDFVENVVEVSVEELLANRIAYAGQLVTLNAEGNYYAEILEDVYAGTTSTTAYMYWNASEVFDVEVYDGTTFVSPKMTEDYYNYVGKLFNVQGENLPVASFDANETINVVTARFDWNAIAMGQSLLVKDYIVGEEEPVVPPTAMPANGVIYFDPAGKFTEDLTVRFIGADGSVQDAAEVINVGEIYRITMPAGNEWMRFEVDAWGDDPTTPESNFVQLYLVSGLVYTGEYNLFTLNADAPSQATAENGVWSNHVVQPIQGGSVFFYSLAESAYFSEAEEGLFTWKTFFVNAEGTEAEVEVELIDDDIYKIVAPEGTWEMLRISLYVAASGREVNRLYLENDGEHNMFKLGADASPYALVGSWDVYNTEVPEVIATWSIEEGAVLESFTGVTVTFSGVDPRGRKVDGTEVTRVLSVISAVPTFFVVNEDGTTTPVVAGENDSYSGILTCSASGVTSTLSLGTDRYTLVDGAFLKNGNYRIVLPANKVQYLPNVDGTKVYAEKDFVLNFSIVNDYVEPAPVTEIEVPFTVSVENNSTVAELSEIVITYPDVARIRVSEPMAPQSPATWVFLSQTLVDETGNVTASQAMAPLYWQQVSANSFKVMVNLSAIGGPETLTMEGTYSIDVPAGLVMFSETEVNKAFSLNYTIETVSPEEPAGPIEVTTMDELKAHAGETVIYKGLEPTVVTMGWETMTLMPDGETMLYCELTSTLPARFDAKGVYVVEEEMTGFRVDEVVAIEAFNTLSDLKNFFMMSYPTDEQKAAAYEIKGSVVVTYVDVMFGKIYAQYEGTNPYGMGTMMYGIEFTLAGPRPRAIGESVDPTQLQLGDEIVVTGIYTAAVYNDETGDLISPESFALTAVNLVSQNNELKATPVSSIDEAKWSCVSGYMSIKGGAVAEGVTGYTLTDAYGGVLNVMQASAETDLSAYVGKELDKILVGVLTYNAMLQDYVLYALELRDTRVYYDNIAALLAAGPQMDYSISRALSNPVVVNYIFYNQWSGYTLFVEDATGVLVVKGVGVMDEDGNYIFPYEVEAGDSILGIDGVLDNGVMWTGADCGINVDLTYVSEGEVNVIEVALDALVEDQAAWQEASWNGEVYVSPYANRVVKLTDLTLEETDDDATAYWVQGESKLEFNPRLWNRLGLEVPANVAALTGIADYEGIWNYSFTVIPTNVEVEDDCTVFVAGSFNNWNPSDPEHCMVLGDLAYVKTYKNLPAGSYEFKVVYKGQWLGAEYVDAANSTKGYVGVPGGNISFTLPQAATVTISYYDCMGAIYLVAEGIDQFGQFEIEYYSVCGSKEIFGEEFLTDAYREKIDDYKMVEEDGVYTKTFTSIHLDADVEYRYKVAANGTWNEGQYPQNGDMLFTVPQTGIYDLTFTYIPDSDLLRVDPVFIESSNVIDSVYYEEVICYGDVYEFGGMVLSETGTYELWEGSNTLAILNLTVLPDYRQTYDATIEEGEVYSGYGFEGLTFPGTYSMPLVSIGGCDSTITLNLSVVAAGEGEMPMEVEFANIAAIYEMGMWDMKYYESYLNYDVKAILKSQPTVVDKVVLSSAWGTSVNNYYLNDGTGVIVLQAPSTSVDWMGSIVEGLELEVGKKLPADLMATIDFKCLTDNEKFLPTGKVYGAPVMTFVPKVVGVDSIGMEITESYAAFVIRCEASDFVEEPVEVSVDELLANRIAYAGQLVALNAEGNYYAEVLKDEFSGVTTTTAYMYWNTSEVFDVEIYDGTTYVSPKMTEDFYNYLGKLFNVQGENLPVATFDANKIIDVTTARFDWNSIAMSQSLLVKEYTIEEEKESAMTATWSIEDGAVLESFVDVTVSFAGVDSVGRKLDGVEVTGIVPNISTVSILHALNEDGTTKSSSTMSRTYSGLSATFSAKTTLTDGKYRISLPAGVIVFNPRRKDADGTSLPVVKNDKEFVLNFTINGNAAGEEEEIQTDTATVTTMAEVITALGKKSKVVVLFKNLKPITKTGGMFYDDYMPDGTTKLNMGGYTLPADFDCYGTYVAEDNKFTVDSIVGLHAFANLYLLKNYYETNKSDANILNPLNITDPVVVTGVDGNNVFVQYAYARIDDNMFNEHLVINGEHSLKVGDQIASFTAQYKKSTSLTLDEENTVLVRNAYFAVEVTSFGAITHDNAIKYASLSSINNISSKAANAVQLPAGGIIVKENSKYFYTIGTDSLEIRPATGVEIESFVGKEMNLSIRGIVDYCNTADYANAFIANSIKEINTNYETIAQWLNAAVDGNGLGSLKNPVVVTHSEYRNNKQYIFISDTTGALCLMGEAGVQMDYIKTGHVITGVTGKLDFSDTKKTPQLSVPSDIQVVDSNKTIEPVEVTIAELLEEENNAINNGRPAIKYANRLVTIRKVLKGTKWFAGNPRIYPLIQGEDTLAYATNILSAYHTLFSTTVPMAITGIVDFRCINSNNLYSIYPRSAEDVKCDLVQPVITPYPGVYDIEELELTITCEDPAVTAIYYSLDPEIDPTVDGELYEGPITINQDTTIWYVAEYGDMVSEVYEASYKFGIVEVTGYQIDYEYNGGVSNPWGWQNKQDMYEALNADYNAYTGKTTIWTPLDELTDIANGIPTGVSSWDMTFFTSEIYSTKWGWLVTYMDNQCAEQGKTLPSIGGSSHMRYNLAAFFSNTVRVGWPQSADYTLSGDISYFQKTWKAGFDNPKIYVDGDYIVLNTPYREGYTFTGWYIDEALTQKVTTIVGINNSISLYAGWTEYIPTIAEVIAMEDNTATRVQGTVTYVAGKNFWIQDATAGILCYGANDLSEGELVTLAGDKVIYKGSPELNNATIVARETAEEVVAQKLIISDILADSVKSYATYLNEVVYLEGLTISKYEGDYATPYVTDGINEFALYKWDGVTEDKYPVGTKVSVKAVLAIYNTTLQLRGKEEWLVLAAPISKDTYEYSEVQVGGLTHRFKNDWLYSATLENWADNRPNPVAEGTRSIIEKDGIIYFPYRNASTPTEQPKLVRVDAETGKMLSPVLFADYIFKDTNGEWLLGPYNDLKLDNAGNAITSNLVTYGEAFQIWSVDLETGEGRLIIDLATDSMSRLGVQFPYAASIRLDRIGVYGDINGDATIMSVISGNSDNAALSWNIVDGKWDGKTNWISLDILWTSLSGAPTVTPVKDGYFYVDALETYPFLFDPYGNKDGFTSGAGADHLTIGSKGVKRSQAHNGVTEFEVNGEYYLLIAGDNTEGNATAPSTFVLYKFADENRVFGDMTQLWEFPMDGMGRNSNTQRTAASFVRPSEDGSKVDIYVFTAENGYGKYTMHLGEVSFDDLPENITIHENITLTVPDSLPEGYKPTLQLTNSFSEYGDYYTMASLILNGENVLSLSYFDLWYNFGDDYSNNLWYSHDEYNLQKVPYYNSFVCNAPVRADQVAINMSLRDNVWNFVSLPFDIKVSDILSTENSMFVVRKYSGADRAAANFGATWQNMTVDSILRAGEGYIWQSSHPDYVYTQFMMYAQDNVNKNNIFATTDRSVKLNEYLSEFEHNRSWNLIGNPYPTFFDIKSTDFTAPITVWNMYDQTYEAYSPIDDNYVLTPGEAFFVQKPIDVDAITFYAEGRMTNTQVEALANDYSNSMTRVRANISSYREIFNLELFENEVFKDKTRFVLNEQADINYEINCDASKFVVKGNDIAQIYTRENDVDYAINERPMGNGIVNLVFETSKAGEYTISLSTTSYRQAILVDKVLNSEVVLNESEYTFYSEAGVMADRFYIMFRSGVTTDVKDNDVMLVDVYERDGQIVVDASKEAQIKLYSVSGAIVAEEKTDKALFNVESGVYVVMVDNNIYKVVVTK